jgi:hypothetical protein
MFRVDEVITRKEVSIVFDNGNITAGLPKDAKRMLLPEGSSGCFLEDLYFDPLDILAYPLIENGAEKIAQSFSRHSAVAHPALLVWLRLNEGQKLQGLGFGLLEEPVNLDGILDVLRMHHAKDIARDLVLAQELIPMHRLLVGGVLAFGDAVPVMHSLRTIQTKPYAKALCR